MDRRELLKGLFGVAGAGALAVVLPSETQALPAFPPDDPATGSNVLPNLESSTDAAAGATGAIAGAIGGVVTGAAAAGADALASGSGSGSDGNERGANRIGGSLHH